ncbi:MAG: hypothetical protein AAGJ32_08580 [Pseudomonadota bacterium]
MTDSAIETPTTAQAKPKAPPKTKAKPKGGKTPPWGRLLIATFLGYLTTVLISAALTSLLPIHRAEATMMSLLIAGIVYVILFLRVFAVRSWQRALIEVLAASFLAGAILLVTKGVII